MTFFPIFILTLIFFSLAMAGLGVSTILTRGERCLRGNCGGEEPVFGPDGEDLRCDTCPKRDSGECPEDEGEDCEAA